MLCGVASSIGRQQRHISLIPGVLVHGVHESRIVRRKQLTEVNRQSRRHTGGFYLFCGFRCPFLQFWVLGFGFRVGLMFNIERYSWIGVC